MPYIPKPQTYYIVKCRYYHGEEECPFVKGLNNDHLLWFYEQKWVEYHCPEHIADLQEMVEDYKAYGHGQFQKEDGVPVSLKALLWNRWAKWVSSPSDSKGWHEFYLHDYLKK